MFKLNFKIAIRNLRKNYGVTMISIGGLAIALSAFIMILLYVSYEKSYDKSNPDYANIYQVGRRFKDYNTSYTPAPLAQLIKENCPEVVAVGKMQRNTLDFAVISGHSKIYLNNCLTADYDAAQMFRLYPENGLKKPAGKEERLFYLNNSAMRALFPGKKNDSPELVMLGSKNTGQTATVSGAIVPDIHSNIQYDALSIAYELGTGEGFSADGYLSYIRVKPGTDLNGLQQKIEQLYQAGMRKDGISAQNVSLGSQVIFLDPLSNLHLKPQAGTDTAYKVVMVILLLGFLILLMACINFTNLTIAQASKRAKEVGVKKVLGAQRQMLTLQFITEIFVQCVIAIILSLILAELFLPAFNNFFHVPLSIWHSNSELIFLIPLLLLGMVMVAGIYPAFILSGFKPASVLKGNFQTSIESHWLQRSLLVFQFTIAVIFIAGLLIVSAQLRYMRSADMGFNPSQVVYIKNIVGYNQAASFSMVRQKIMKIEGIQSVTVANVIPDGSATGSNTYSLEGKEKPMDFIDVDFDYFETLGIKLKEGRLFSTAFKTDTASSAILNESAVAHYGLKQPIGKTIQGCKSSYTIVGVIKDFKSQGFENAVRPTIYTMNNKCSGFKTCIMLKIDAGQMASALAALKSQWMDINKYDGEDMRYEFLDDRYGKLFQKQELLQSLFFSSSMVTICIAVLGLFAMAKFMTTSRTKEIAVRKILGANNLQILKLLNSSFLLMAMLANLLAWPVAYILAEKWLKTFAYRVDLSFIPFVTAALITILITVITVSLQAAKTVKRSPVKALRYE